MVNFDFFFYWKTGQVVNFCMDFLYILSQEQKGSILANLSHALTIFVDKWGGVQFCDSKTLTHMMVSVVVLGGV